MIKKTIILTALTITLTSCSLNPLNSTLDTIGNATDKVGGGIGKARAGAGIEYTGRGINNFAKAQIQEQVTNQLEIQAGEKALKLAAEFIPTITDEALRVKTYNETMQTYKEINANQETTRQSHHRYKWWSGVIIGVLLGFILLGLMQAIGKQLSRIEVKPM